MTAERYYGPIFFDEDQIRNTFFNVFLSRRSLRGALVTHYFGPSCRTRQLADVNQHVVESHGRHRAAYRIRVKSKRPEAADAR